MGTEKIIVVHVANHILQVDFVLLSWLQDGCGFADSDAGKGYYAIGKFLSLGHFERL